MISLRLQALLAAAALALGGCRTTAGHGGGKSDAAPAGDGDGSAASGLSLNGPGGASSLASSLELSKDEEQALYLQMLGVEVQNGVKVPQEQIHSSRGLFVCRSDVAPATCQLQVRLDAGALSVPQPVTPVLASKVFAFAQASRPDLVNEHVLLVDATCNYVGKASPPYTVEDVRCVVSLARATDEAVFDGRLAEELGEDLRGDQPYGTGTVTLMGSLACQWLPGSPRTPCVARALVGGVLQEKVTEVSTGGSAEAARKMRQALFDHAAVTGAPAPGSVTAVSGALVCLVDNSKIESEGRRSYVCRAKL